MRRWAGTVAVVAGVALGGVAVLPLESTVPVGIGSPDRVAVVAPDTAPVGVPERQPLAPSDPVDASGGQVHAPEATKVPTVLTGPARTPVNLTIKRIGVDAPIAVTTEEGGALVIPHDVGTVGWDDQTKRPGARHGTALLAGHLDNASGDIGALHDLASVQVGDSITVETGGGDQLAYAVTAVDEYPKTALPAAIVATTGPPRLAVVTCGGPLVESADGLFHYRDNTVVWAVPA